MSDSLSFRSLHWHFLWSILFIHLPCKRWTLVSVSFIDGQITAIDLTNVVLLVLIQYMSTFILMVSVRRTVRSPDGVILDPRSKNALMHKLHAQLLTSYSDSLLLCPNVCKMNTPQPLTVVRTTNPGCPIAFLAALSTSFSSY